jgi:DNA-binding protein H-NS
MMANIDLSDYTLSELKGLQHDIEKEIKLRQQQDLQKARKEILAIAQEAGISVEELLAINAKKAKKEGGKKVKPQYQNPADGSQTWTGRGRQPRWLADAIAKGKTLDDFRIQSAPGRA